MNKSYRSLIIILCLLLVPAIIYITVKPPRRPNAGIQSEATNDSAATTVKNGFITENGKLYYYVDGAVQSGGIVGPATPDFRYADNVGVCCTSEEIRLAANFIKEHGEGESVDEILSSCFMYLALNYEYERDYLHPAKAEDIPEQAIVMFRTHKGNCYKYAACYACIAAAMGYPARVVIGGLPHSSGEIQEHAWTEVYIDDYWYVYDANAQMQEYWNTLGFYKMESHSWITEEYDCFEVSIDENGNAVWRSVMDEKYSTDY